MHNFEEFFMICPVSSNEKAYFSSPVSDCFFLPLAVNSVSDFFKEEESEHIHSADRKMGGQ